MNTASILGVQFHAVTKKQAVELAMSKLRARQKGYVVTPNPEIVDLCRRDSEFMGIVNHAALVMPDGIGIEVPVDETTLRPVTVESPLPEDMTKLFV